MTAVKKLANEPALILAVVVAAINGATDQTWKGYAVAIFIALLRFIVTGPLTDK